MHRIGQRVKQLVFPMATAQRDESLVCRDKAEPAGLNYLVGRPLARFYASQVAALMSARGVYLALQRPRHYTEICTRDINKQS